MASLMFCGVAYIEYVNWKDVGSAIHLAGCCASIVAALALLVYAVFFFRKTKKLT